jgi:hypothetical protein
MAAFEQAAIFFCCLTECVKIIYEKPNPFNFKLILSVANQEKFSSITNH